MGSDGRNPGTFSNCPPGVNDVDYHCRFGGTSAATPQVAGIAALLLSKHPSLTSGEVYDIIKYSAVLPDTLTAPDLHYGYGRVDVFRAVLSISHGNIDNDSAVVIDIGDLTYLINYLYTSGPEPFPSRDLANWDCDDHALVDIGDLSATIGYLYLGGPPPANPCFVFQEDVQ